MCPILDLCWQDKDGNLSNGAIANLVDVAGASLIYVMGLPMNVSVDMSISYVSKAKIDVSKLSTQSNIYSPFFFHIHMVFSNI